MKFFFIAALLLPVLISAQNVFDDSGFGFAESESGGFGFEDVSPPGWKSSVFANIGGEISAGFTGFFDNFESLDVLKDTELGDVFSGSLKVRAGGPSADGVINLNMHPVFDGTSPIEIDEAYLRAFFGPFSIQGGLRKLFWGKADSMGPLDVINPLDYRDLTKLSDPQSVKIARPMIQSAIALNSFTKLEAVFVPWFQGHRFAATGRWMPDQIGGAIDIIAAEINKKAAEYLTAIYMANSQTDPDIAIKINEREKFIQMKMGELMSSINLENLYPYTRTIRYAQSGMRFTTSAGSSDFGFQYYFGRNFRPVITFSVDDGIFTPYDPLDPYNPDTEPNINTEKVHLNVTYNYYHQIAFDFARVIAGFNIRAEAGVNLTRDLYGTNGTVENPSVVWSLGFDRNLFAGINLNLQGTGRYMIHHGKLGATLLNDCEAGKNLTSTRLTGVLSKKFIRDELELKVSGLWGIEDKDFLVMPAIVWSRNGVTAELSAGIFGGDRKGELGQYKDNGFIRAGLSYKF